MDGKMPFLELISVPFTLVGAILLGKKNINSWYWLSFGCLILIGFGIATYNWAQVFVFLIYLGSNINGYRQWKKDLMTVGDP